MKTIYNIISLETGKIRKRIEANSFDDAVQIASNLFNCYILDDYIVETSSETEIHRSQQTRWWSLQSYSDNFDETN